MKVFVLLLFLFRFLRGNLERATCLASKSRWQKLQFYQTTDFGILLAGSENSLVCV